MPQVQCTIYGDLPDSGSACYLHIEAPVTINKVDDSFPFEGKFHYRAKVPGRELGLRDVDYVWMDIIDRNMPLMFSNDLIELRVLPLEIPTEPVEDSAAIEHIEKILEHVPKDRPIAQREEPYRDYIQQPNQQQRSANKPAQSFGNFAKSLNKALPSQISNVKDSANSIWKAMKSKAVNFLSNEADIPKENAYVLAELAGKATTSFSDYEESHAMILERLWNNLFPGQEYQRDNVGWKQAGFQKSDPVADLKNSGILALCSMVTFIEMYTDRARSMIEKNKINTKTNYPFAIVGINLTLLLIELFCLRNSK